ncbi:MAG: hypothetical protein ABIH92_00415, partial [Nanoarchaeota archaeon]
FLFSGCVAPAVEKSTVKKSTQVESMDEIRQTLACIEAYIECLNRTKNTETDFDTLNRAVDKCITAATNCPGRK